MNMKAFKFDKNPNNNVDLYRELAPISFNDLSDKPFYEEKVERVVVDKWTGIPNLSEAYDPVPFTLKPETQYAVYFDGVRYACATGGLGEGDTHATLSYEDETGSNSPFLIDAALDEANIGEGYIQCPVGNHSMSIYEIVEDKEIEVYTYPNGVTGYWFLVSANCGMNDPMFNIVENLTKPGRKYIVGLNDNYYEFVSKIDPECDNDVTIGNSDAGIRIRTRYNAESSKAGCCIETNIPGPVKFSLHELTDDLRKVEIMPEYVFNEVVDISFTMHCGDLVEDNTYIVDFNGTKYECVAQKPSGFDPELNAACFGNLSFMNKGGISYPDTGEPFLILKSYDEVYIYMFKYVYAIVSISKVETVVHQLDPKYVAGGGYDLVLELIGDAYGTTCECRIADGSVNKCLEAAKNMRKPKVLLYMDYYTDGPPARDMFEADVISIGGMDNGQFTDYSDIIVCGKHCPGYDSGRFEYKIRVGADSVNDVRLNQMSS